MVLVAGIDIGSRGTKAVLVNESRQVCGTALVKTRPDFPGVAKEAMEQALAKAGGCMADVKYVTTTGLGRYNVPFRDLQITDITCAARGAEFLFPNTACVLDVGGQSTRAIRLREGGK
ncbi:MAG: BadF/BadG/BcrA/BcrD ATPase family protein, partial [Candidatus Acidiferrales bacterium]